MTEAKDALEIERVGKGGGVGDELGPGVGVKFRGGFASERESLGRFRRLLFRLRGLGRKGRGVV